MAANLLQQRVANKLEFVCRTLRFTRRRLCAVATKQQQEAHQTGVPLIIPPHVIAKAFIVHPSTTSAFDASSKYQWLTKTKLYEGLPASFSNVDNLLNDEEYVVLKEQFKKSILQNHAFRKEGTSRNHRLARRGQEIRLGVLQDLLRFGWSLSDRFPHLDDCFLDLKPKMRIHWVRYHNFFQLDQQPAYVIRTKQPTPLFEPGKFLTCKSLTLTPPGGGGEGWGYSSKLCWGCAPRFFKPLPVFRPKYVIFPTQFQTWPLKIPPFSIQNGKNLCPISDKQANVPSLRPKCSKSIPIF